MAWLPNLLMFLVWPAGRSDRRRFATGWILSLIAFTGLAWATSALPASIPAAQTLLPGAGFACLWCKCALTSRRLHDIGWPGWLTFPGVILVVVGLGNRLATPVMEFLYSPLPFLHKIDQIGAYCAVLLALVCLADLILCFIPGNKTANRYGPAAGQPRVKAQDLF